MSPVAAVLSDSPSRSRSASQWIRQTHRWLSIAFTAGVISYMVAMRNGTTPPAWMGLLALVPLILLLVSGLYLFVLPYSVRWRGTRRAS